MLLCVFAENVCGLKCKMKIGNNSSIQEVTLLGFFFML